MSIYTFALTHASRSLSLSLSLSSFVTVLIVRFSVMCTIPALAIQFEYARRRFPFLGPCQSSGGHAHGWYVTGTSRTDLNVKLACFVSYPSPAQLSIHNSTPGTATDNGTASMMTLDKYVAKYTDEWPRIIRSVTWQFFVGKLPIGDAADNVEWCLDRIEMTLRTLRTDDEMEMSSLSSSSSSSSSDELDDMEEDGVFYDDDGERENTRGNRVR